MKSNEKKLITILLIITIIMAIVFIRTRKNKNSNSDTNTEEATSQSEYIQEFEDGTKQSTSNKLEETKTIGDIEINNIQIIEKSGTATLTATVTNNSSSTKKEFPLTIKLLNKSGEIIETLGAYVGTIKSGETRGINASINMDISEIYDISIEL